jgi:uncharacterized lipoprotein YmbA
MTRWSRSCFAAICASAMLVLVACGSSPAVHYYTLTSLPEGAVSPTSTAGRQGIIAIGPVELADYLDRPQIVRRSGPTTLSLLEVDRWAGSLQSDLARVLVDNFAKQLAAGGYLVLPWETTDAADSRIQVSVIRLEGTHQQGVLLDALWTLHGRERGEPLAAGKEIIVEPVTAEGGAALVEAMSRSLAELSRRIAAEVGKALAPAG